MADGRMLKKKLSMSTKFAALKTDSARMLYCLLLSHLDVAGRYHADPRIVKGYVVPIINSMDVQSVGGCLDDMVKVGLIRRYSENGDVFLEYIHFKKNQNLRENREKASEIPPPPGNCPATARQQTAQAKIREVKIREDKGVPTEVETSLVELLKYKILENKPDTIVKERGWFNVVRLMLGKDKRSPEKIKAMIEFSQNDDFWKCNILSMGALREKFDQLGMKAQRKTKRGKSANTNEMLKGETNG